MISNKTDAAHRHNFDLLKGGEFYPGKRYGKNFFKTGICKKKSLSPDKTKTTTDEDRNGNNDNNCIHIQ